MVIAIVPFVVALAGALMYAFASNPKLVEIGRLLFFAGVLALVWALSTHAVRIG